jgi:thioredoxin 1
MKFVLNDSELEKNLQDIGKKLIVFSADWCGPCRLLKPQLEKVSEEIEDLEILVVDVSEIKEHTKNFEIKSIPVCILLENREELGRFTGVKTKDQIKNFILDHNN